MNQNKKYSRKEIELAQRRSYILDRAEQLFADKGFENVSMAQIAESTEFSVGSLYNLIPSKNEIFSEILCRKMKIIYFNLKEIDNTVSDPLEKIKVSLRFHIKFFFENHEFVKLYNDDFERYEWGLPTRFQEREVNLIENTQQIAVDMISYAQKRGVINNAIAPEKLVIILQKIVTGFHVFFLKKGMLDEMNDAADEIIDIFLNGVGTGK